MRSSCRSHRLRRRRSAPQCSRQRELPATRRQWHAPHAPGCLRRGRTPHQAGEDATAGRDSVKRPNAAGRQTQQPHRGNPRPPRQPCCPTWASLPRGCRRLDRDWAEGGEGGVNREVTSTNAIHPTPLHRHLCKRGSNDECQGPAQAPALGPGTAHLSLCTRTPAARRI